MLSVRNVTGEVFVDDFAVGQLQKDGQLIVANLAAGQHTFRIVMSGDRVVRGPATIKPNETTYVLSRQPEPPTGLTATVQ